MIQKSHHLSIFIILDFHNLYKSARKHYKSGMFYSPLPRHFFLARPQHNIAESSDSRITLQHVMYVILLPLQSIAYYIENTPIHSSIRLESLPKNAINASSSDLIPLHLRLYASCTININVDEARKQE
ncbi:hypothetical protein EYC84_006979 [Monilinia fructicola]|uniref:Uncharacterized protein n=1 Tax=Monilinia fructicola TaxID=38448 RepID=A0A5M9K9L9_MONFR|nr:hypothetical protein EYC84_006979 [Monilinia fructicola]